MRSQTEDVLHKLILVFEDAGYLPGDPEVGKILLAMWRAHEFMVAAASAEQSPDRESNE